MNRQREKQAIAILVGIVVLAGCTFFYTTTIILFLVQFTLGTLGTFLVHKIASYLNRQKERNVHVINCWSAAIFLAVCTIGMLVHAYTQGSYGHLFTACVLAIATLMMLDTSANAETSQWIGEDVMIRAEVVHKLALRTDVFIYFMLPVCVLCILYMNNYSDNMTRELSVIAKYLEVLLELPTLLLYCV